nr:MAG TPA: tumor necrosis factor receptor superfamily member 19 [Caudoviricetes sp.]
MTGVEMNDSRFDMLTGFLILLMPVIGMLELDKFDKFCIMGVLGVVVACCVVKILNRPL